MITKTLDIMGNSNFVKKKRGRLLRRVGGHLYKNYMEKYTAKHSQWLLLDSRITGGFIVFLKMCLFLIEG